MAPKPKRSWFDVQMAIMTISMATVLGLWNLFAGPDRETALRKAAAEQANQPEPVATSPNLDAPTTNTTTVAQPQPGEKIMLGGSAPQTQIVIQRGSGKSNTSTGSS